MTVGQTGKAVGETKGYKKMVAHSVTFQVADDQHGGKMPGGLLFVFSELIGKSTISYTARNHAIGLA